MPKRLTDAFVRTAKHSGKLSRNGKPRADTYHDEHGLFLRVQPSGSRQWMWRGTVHGKRVDLGLGGYPYTSLAEARGKAFDHKKLARDGGDPRTARGRGVPAFKEAAGRVIALHAKNWKGHVNERQWANSLAHYVYPHIGRQPVDKITTDDVMRVLLHDDLWHSKAETARRVRQRIGAVMKWAVAKGYRADNPAGNALGAALPRHNGRKQHFRSLPHAQVAEALEKVHDSGAWAGTKLAIEFMVLTATRPGETRLATWKEIDFDTATWTIPPERMKARKAHRVPLSPRALQVLEEAKEIRDHTGLIFPSVMGKAAANVTYTKLLRGLEINAVSHGFRSSFRVWCGDNGVDREVAERALAHTVRNPVEAAYNRGTLFARRRTVMDCWGQYIRDARDCTNTPARL